MPTPCFMQVTSQGTVLTEGAYTEDSIGTGYIEGKEDYFIVQGISHEVITPRDPQTGQTSGRRVHQPLTVTKFVDKSSALLAGALSRGMLCENVVLEFYRTSAAGEQEHYYTIELEDARISSLRLYMPNALDPANESMGHMEEIAFSYRLIRWTHEITGVAEEDDWRSSMA